MVDEYINEIIQIRENLEVLPHEKKSEKDKYYEYVHNNLNKYNKMFEELNELIKKRYYDILNSTPNQDLKMINDMSINYSLLKQINPYTNSLQKMGLDINLYKLKHFYNGNLTETNEIIKEIIKSFESVGVVLSIKDFNYTTYVNNYMSVLLDKTVSPGKIYKTFEEIYWKCPDVINHIKLNFYKIYYSNEKNINKFYETVDNHKDEYVRNFTFLMDKKEKIIHNDRGYIINRFFEKELSTKDFIDSNTDKLKDNYIVDKNNSSNYSNLIKLYNNLILYKQLLTHEKVINKVKELYKEKETYNELFNTKRKEIIKKELDLDKLNKKYNSKGFFGIKENKKPSVLLEIQNICNEIDSLYVELESLGIKDSIYKNIVNDSKIPDVLQIANADFWFIHDICKEENSDCNLDNIIDYQQSIDSMLFNTDLDIINHVHIVDEKKMSTTIADHYKLLNIIVDENRLFDPEIDNVLKELDILITKYDMDVLEINIDDVDYLLNVRKENIL